MDRFDLLGPLPIENSTTVLEASAGTGKTFALAGLVTRYVAANPAAAGFVQVSATSSVGSGVATVLCVTFELPAAQPPPVQVTLGET